MRCETERQTKQVLEDRIIEESSSPWHDPILLVCKKNNEGRFAVDYFGLNSVTEPMLSPLPHISDVLDTIADARDFHSPLPQEWLLAVALDPSRVAFGSCPWTPSWLIRVLLLHIKVAFS